MNYIDISTELNEQTVVWKEDQPPQLKPICRIPAQPCNFTWLNFSAHAGTHIDAPYYLFPEGWTAEQVPLSRLIGVCQVIDLGEVPDLITREHLKSCKITLDKLLIKTANSFDGSGEYNPNHVALDRDAAEYLIEKGITTLGFDYQSFERDGENKLHRLFLEKNITLIDNLKLGQASAGRYFLLCLPVKVTGIDAAPARAILLEESAWKQP